MRCQCVLLVILVLINMNSSLGNGTYQPCKTPQYVEFGTKGIVHCNFTATFFGIYWYNTTDHVNDFSLIDIKSPGNTKSGPGFTSGDYDIYPNGSLIIKKVNLGNAHNYTVVKLDSPTDEIIPRYIDVIVVALPTPPYPVIEGCTSQQGCEMKVDHRGNLTCSLKGITPPVDLEWRSIEDDSSVTFIHHQQSKTRSEDGRYHVVLTSIFHLESTSDYSLNVECRVAVSEEGPKLDLRSAVYLFSTGEANDRTTPPNREDINEFPVIAVIVPAVVVMIAIITSVVYMILRCRKPNTGSDTERTERLDAPQGKKKIKKQERIPLLESKAKADRLKQHLGTIYKNAFGSIRVISTIKDENDAKQTTEMTKAEVTMQTEPKDNVKHVENENFLTDGGNNKPSTKQVDEKSTVEEDHNDVQLQTSDLDSKEPEMKILRKENTIIASNTMNSTGKDEADSSGYIQDKLLIEPVIQMLNLKPGTGTQGVWKNVESVGNVLIDSSNESKCFIVEGEFGYGLSTISKLLAHEWSTKEDSELAKCFNVLVVLKCNEISDDQSIYAEIKRLLADTDPTLTENDIEGVLCDEHNKVALVLDGSNMNTGVESKINSDLKRIITREIMKECTVIIITSTPCALNEFKDFMRLRALDLNEKDQKVLIREEVVHRNTGTEEQIITYVQENTLLKDILRIPFFFLFFLRRACILPNLSKFNSVTKFFLWIISELSRQCHMKHRAGADVWEDETVAELGKLAFEALTSKHKWGKNWSKSEVFTRLKEDAYQFYKQMGIICEEMLPKLNSASINLENASAHLEVRTRFTHSLFIEWYAAHHLRNMFKSQDRQYMKGLLNVLSSTNCWYCIRFICGIDQDRSGEVCEAVEHEVLQLLCKIESHGGLTEDTLKKGWPKQMSLSVADSRVQQLATVQLLEVGSKKELQSLKLENCFNSVKDGSGLLELKSGVELPALANLKHLDVIEEGSELTNIETTGILKFASKCTKLKNVRFSYCILPQTLDDVTIDGTTKSKDVKVQWTPYKDSSETYSLDWKTCSWKKSKGEVVDDYVYKELVTEIRRKHGIRF